MSGIATCRIGLMFAVFVAIVKFQALVTRNRAFNNLTIDALDIFVTVIIAVKSGVVFGAASISELSTESGLLRSGRIEQ